MSVLNKPSKATLRYGLYALLLVLLAVVLVGQHEAFGDSLTALGHRNLWWTVGGFAVLLLSVPASANVYRTLSPKRLPFKQVALIEAASLGVNKLLPAGSGALGINYLYLRKKRLTRAVAGSVVAANNIIGFMGHAVLLLVLCLLWTDSLNDFGSGDIALSRLGLVGIIIVTAIAAALIVFWAQVRTFAKSVLPLLLKPDRLGAALLWSIAITACYLVALLFACGAMGVGITPASAIVVLSFSVLSVSVIPVPGGIGAAEAGVYAGLYSLGVDTSTALAVAILYRVMTFWLPLVVGSGAFAFVAKRRLLV